MTRFLRRLQYAGVVGLWLGSVMLTGGGLAWASSTEGAAADALTPQLAALDSHDYRERQAQTRQMLADETLTLDDFAAMLARAESAEQRHRLLAIARHHVLRTQREQIFDQPDRGSLGISHRTLTPADLPDDSHTGGAAVEIVLTLPGFPAYAALEPGDRVIGIDGEPLPDDFTAEHFRDVIMNYESGDTIALIIERHGERVRQSVELASAQALSAMYDSVRLQLRPQFENAWQRAQRTLLNATTSAPAAPPLRVEPGA